MYNIPNAQKIKKLILYYAVSLLTESYNLNEPIVNKKQSIEKVKQQINKIYIQIQKK